MFNITELIEEVKATSLFIEVPSYKYAKKLRRKVKDGDLTAARKMLQIYFYANPKLISIEQNLAFKEIELAYENLLDLTFEE